ncbi:MAG: NCS2 family permease [Thermoguttaceae bacterium]|jgi:AGZA family xanthine/uracil permease-like MFS transporter|nr:NCS2 family permease [Thermoguttaceae bacterium]
MLERIFKLAEHGTNVRTELLAGLTTFLTMAYIIFLQPAILSGRLFGMDTGMDWGAIMTATCLAAALATFIMGVYANYPIGQAPGMGENFFFVFSVIPAAAAVASDGAQPWQIALGVVFIAGLLFLLLAVLGVREILLEAISPSMRNAIAVGIGVFVAFIGLQNAGLIVPSPGTCVKLSPRFSSPDILLFAFGLVFTAGLFARRVRGAIVWGILATTAAAAALQWSLPWMPQGWVQSEAVAESGLVGRFAVARTVVELPPSIAPTLMQMDLRGALSLAMLPFILIFLFMDLFDTLGTLLGVSEQAGLVKDNRLPRAREAFMSDAIGTAAGAAMGTSTVTSFIESTAGVEQGGRTGLTACTTAMLFLGALFFAPIVRMVGDYPAITAPALVLVGAMMMRNVAKIDWSDYTEAMPSFLMVVGIPLTYSIGDGLALGFIAYPIIKLAGGRRREVKWLMLVMAAVLTAYFFFLRAEAG